MAHNNTAYYLNSQETDLDNEILMSPCSKVLDDDMEYNYYDDVSLTCTVTPLKQFDSSSRHQKYVYRRINDRNIQWCP